MEEKRGAFGNRCKVVIVRVRQGSANGSSHFGQSSEDSYRL